MPLPILAVVSRTVELDPEDHRYERVVTSFSDGTREVAYRWRVADEEGTEQQSGWDERMAPIVVAATVVFLFAVTALFH